MSMRLLSLSSGLARSAASGDSRSIHALVGEVFLGIHAAIRRQFGSARRRLRIGVANDDHGALGFVLQTQAHIVEDTLADIVHARRLAGLKSQLFILLATGGGGGACTVIALEASAAPPRPSSSRTVTVQEPAGNPVVSSVSVVPLPLSWPQVVRQV